MSEEHDKSEEEREEQRPPREFNQFDLAVIPADETVSCQQHFAPFMSLVHRPDPHRGRPDPRPVQVRAGGGEFE